VFSGELIQDDFGCSEIAENADLTAQSPQLLLNSSLAGGSASSFLKLNRADYERNIDSGTEVRLSFIRNVLLLIR